MSLEITINDGIKQAMLGKREAELRALRAIKSAILLANTSTGSKQALTNDEEMKLLQKLVKMRRDSLDIYNQQNRADLAAIESEEIAVIEQFLPKQMDAEELKNTIQEIITKVGATSIQDLGKVMGIASKELAGKADGKAISALVKELLS